MTMIPQNRVITTQYKKLVFGIFEKITIRNFTIIYALNIQLITYIFGVILCIYEQKFNTKKPHVRRSLTWGWL